jgi:hypothetical protein
MSAKFYGKYRQLSKIIANSNYLGAWLKEIPASRRTFKFNNGAIMTWWESTGTVQFQGPSEAKEEIQAAITPLLFRKS